MDGVEQTIRMNNLSKDLRKHGFAANSQEAIAQAGAIYSQNPEELNDEIEQAEITKAQFKEIINKMQRLWIFKNNTNQELEAVSEQLSKVTDKLNQLIKSISIIEMNQAVFEKKINNLKENLHDNFREQTTKKSEKKPQKNKEHVEKASKESSEKEVQEKLDKPIDRNGVAPADVSIDKIFYCGKK